MGTSPVATQAAELHPRIRELIDYLAMHRRALQEAVASVPAELRERKPGDEVWCVAEVLEHLSLIEQRVAALLTVQVTAARASGVGPDLETNSVVASFVNPANVVDRGRKIEAPKPVRPSGALGTAASVQALEQSRVAMLQALRNANGISLEKLTQTHPVLGTLNMYHWIVAAGLHDTRHAAQIREIGQTLAAS